MEELTERELNIVGERYSSFYDAYRTNDSRGYNLVNGPRGDAKVLDAIEIAPGILFEHHQTREALLYGSDLFQEQFEETKTTLMQILGERYEWRDTPVSNVAVFGQHVIVERYMAGHPEAFRHVVPQLRKKRSVYILYDAMCPASAALGSRIKAGCAVLVAVEVLEKLGYEVKLSYGLAKYSGRPVAPEASLLMEIELKGYGEPLNLRKAQFPLASKSVLFHLGCWWAHRFPRTPIDYGEGEGFPLSYNKARVKSMELYAEKQGGVYLSEDIIELQLRMDPVKVLQHILGVIEDEDVLESHARRSTPMESVAQPEQGKIFHSWDPRGETDENVEGPEDCPYTQPDGLEGEDVDENNGSSEESQQELSEERSAENEMQVSTELNEFEQQSYFGGGDDSSESKESEDMQNNMTESRSGSVAHLDTATDDFQNEDAAQDSRTRENISGQNVNETESTREEDRAQEGNSEKESGRDSSTGSSEREDASSSGNDIESEELADNEDKGIGNASDEDNDGEEEKPRIMRAEDEEQNVMEDFRSSMSIASDEFIVELRKRFIRFESGEYLNAMIDQKMARRRAKKEAEANAPAAPMAPGFDPDIPPEPGSRAFAAFAFK